MQIARKLLFHRPDIDDNVGTYVTDYVLAAVCFLMATVLLYRILKNHFSNPEEKEYKCIHFIPWNWPGKKLVPVTMTTYTAVVFQFSYGSTALFGGLPHQYLQQDVEEGSDEEIRWLISWRIAAGLAIVSLCAILTICEQMYQQENFSRIPDLGRKIFYVLLYAGGIAAFVENFVRISTLQPYNITTLFITFMAGIILHGVAMLVLVVRSFIIRCHNQSGGTMIRWDLILHCACPCIMLAGGIFSFILTESCSRVNAHADFGCPLPDEFNHNAIMHLIFALAAVCLGMGETCAVKMRTIASKQEKYKDKFNTERLV